MCCVCDWRLSSTGKPTTTNGRRRIFLLLALSLAACADPGDDIPPALAELHQRATAGDAAAQLDLGLRYGSDQDTCKK
jgi:hypothetical protein